MKSENLQAVTQNNGYAPDITGEGIATSQFEQEVPQSGLNLNDILFIFYKHKWKIFLLATAGFVAAAVVYFLFGSIYESQAKLLVRYVVDKSAIDGLDSQVKTAGAQSETAINSEVEILTSSDLAMQVAEAIGVERLLREPGSKATPADAAGSILQGLTVTPIKGSNIILVSFKNKDPQLATQVLQELVHRYFEKHLEVHRSVGAFDFVTRQADQLRAQLTETEKELRQLQAKAGITSLAESTTNIAAELTKGQEALDAAEAELAAQKARTREIEQAFAAAETKQSGDATPRVSNQTVQEYQSLIARVAQLRQAQTELLSRYSPHNRIAEVKQAQIDDLENQRQNLEKEYPGVLAAAQSAEFAQGLRPDPVSERARLVEIEARTETLRSRLKAVQERAKVLSELSPRIAQLERTKEVEEANYKYFDASVEKARVDETLDPSRMPNISVVQKPSAAVRSVGDVKKIVTGLAAGGLGVGIAIALLIELVIDRTVKRSLELERQLRVPLLLSIPNFGSNGQRRSRLHDAGHDSELVGNGDAQGDLVPREADELLRPFCEAIRDRLGVFFDLNNISHRPKLVAVTGLSKNAGASMLAAGLVRSFSDGAEGKVHFVDKPPAPKRFFKMLADFKASDLDYVVFDMPSLGDTSATLPLAGFMDTVLLVVEAEKSNRDAVKRAYAQLVAKTKVAVVFNKSRSYGPKWIEGEL